jgi:hypothetical protein
MLTSYALHSCERTAVGNALNEGKLKSNCQYHSTYKGLVVFEATQLTIIFSKS